MTTIQAWVYESMFDQKSCTSWLKDSRSSNSKSLFKLNRYLKIMKDTSKYIITVTVPTSWSKRCSALKTR